MSEATTDRVVDKEYLGNLERKLKNLKDPRKSTAKQFISDIANYKDHQVFNLLTTGTTKSSEEFGFEDNFCRDIAIVPNYLRRKVAPQTCAINKQELIHLVKSDLVQHLHEAHNLSEPDIAVSKVFIEKKEEVVSSVPESIIEVPTELKISSPNLVNKLKLD